MANPERGQVEIKTDGQTYTLKFSSNAICEAEAASGRPFGDLCNGLGQADFSAIRVLLWAGLKPAHKDMTLDKAGDIMDDVELLELAPILDKAIELAFPKTTKVGNATARPQKAAKN